MSCRVVSSLSNRLHRRHCHHCPRSLNDASEHVVVEGSGRLSRESHEQRRAAAAAGIPAGPGQRCQRTQHLQYDVVRVNLAEARGKQSTSYGELSAQATAD